MKRNPGLLIATSLIAAAIIAACSSSPDVAPGAADGGEADGPGTGDSASPAEGGGADAVADGAREAGTADADAEASTPSLCSVYPSEAIAYQGDATDRYVVLAFEAAKRAKADCHIASLFASFDTVAPVPLDCLTAQVRSVAGCLDGFFAPLAYDATTTDVNGDACAPSVKLGFRDVTVVTQKDFDGFVEHIRAAAVVAGYSTGAATALVASLNAKKAAIVTSASNAYSNSTCDAGM